MGYHLHCSYIYTIVYSVIMRMFVSFVVLLLGLLFAKKKHHISKFFNVLLIVCGVALFMYSEVSEH